MFKLVRILLFMMSMIAASGQNRAPPGVNPQQYQQAPQMQQQAQYQQGAPGVPPQQYQQNPQQYQQQQQQQQQQQPQYQQQQVPQQQFQQQQVPQQQQFQQQVPQQQQFQQPQQQVPQTQQQAGAHQPHAPGGQKVLHHQNLNDERAHIKDHLDVPLDTSGMSEQELQFHYFKMHDADNNNQLDGQELIKSLFHWHDSENHDDKNANHPPPPGDKLFTDDELVNMIDPILDQDDYNKDGFIDYTEFMAAQKKAASTNTGTTA